MPTRSSRQPVGYAAPTNGARRAPAPAQAHPSSLNFSNVLSGDGGYSSPSGADIPGYGSALQDSNAPFAYSRNHLLSLWNEKATAELPADMAASLASFGVGSGATPPDHLNNGPVNHHYHPAHLVISQDSVGRPLGLSPLTAEEEKAYAAAAAAAQQPNGDPVLNGNGTSDHRSPAAARKNLNGAGAGGLGQDKVGQSPTTSNGPASGALPSASRRISGNPLRSGGAGITGIQGGVLGSVTPGSMTRRAHRTGEGSEGGARLASGAATKGAGPGSGALASPTAGRLPNEDGQQRARDASAKAAASTVKQGHQAGPVASSGAESPPAHWDSEAEEDGDPEVDAAGHKAANHLPQAQRPGMASRPSLADLAIDSEKVDVSSSSRRSSTAASFLADDPLLRRRGLEGSQPNSSSTTPDPTLAAQMRHASPGLMHPPGLRQPSPPKERLEDALWHYQDPSGMLQGPFKGEMMQSWYEQSYFSMDLLVRRASPSSSLQPLAALIHQVGDRLKPFLTPLPSAQPAPALPPWAAPSQQQSAVPSPVSSSTPANGFMPDATAYRPSLSQTSSYDPFSAMSQYNSSPQQQQIQRDPWGMPIQNTGNWTQQQQQYAQYVQQQQQQQVRQQDVQSVMSRFMGQEPMQGRDINMQGHTLQNLHHPQPSQPWARFNRADSPATSAGVIGAPSTPSVKRSESVLAAPDPASTPSVADQTAQTAREPTPTETIAPQESPLDEASQAAERVAQDIIAEEARTEVDAVLASESQKTPKVQVLPAQPPSAQSNNKAKVQSDQQQQAAASSATEAANGQLKEPVASPAASSATSAKAAAAAPWAALASDAPDRAVKSPSGPSLREIQAREAKQEEERRAATKRVKAAALASEQAALAAQAEQEANLPWANAKSAAGGAAGAAWSKPSVPSHNANGTKKTLKEIQEEEEARQRKLNQQRQAVSASTPSANAPPSGARGYAGSLGPRVGVAAPSTPMSAAAASGPWATVGANGKANPAPAATPKAGLTRTPSATVKPATTTITSIASTASPAPAAKRTGSAVVSSAPASAAPSTKATPSPSEHQPSLEFLEWTRAALKGLTIPIDDFITMLLTFPVQADSSTLEIISDAVYANSRTLDGRRFAEQFAVKRKADAGLSTKGKQPTVPPAAPIHLGGQSQPTAAQVLQAKAKSEEALNFKVVPSKKGKKGGRS